MSNTLSLNTIFNQDCQVGLKAFPDNYFDCSVTDPPYGWKFMGKKWDYEIPGVPVWEEVLRVLKPGAHILVACGTRTQHRMAVNIEDAGFEIRDVICWHYGSGFPKSLDISKAIDKAAGAEREIIRACTNELTDGGGYSGNLNISKPRSQSCEISSPASDEAKQWDGWGTALKPATEFWTLARKPLSENTIAQNVVKHGTGGLNIEACRIPFQSEEDKKSATFGTGTSIIGGNYAGGNHTLDQSRKNIEADDAGRFPANLILDDFMANQLDQQTGVLTSGKPSGKRNAGNKSVFGSCSTGGDVTGYGDSGGGIPILLCSQAQPRGKRRFQTPDHQAANPHTIPDQINMPYRTWQDRFRALRRIRQPLSCRQKVGA